MKQKRNELNFHTFEHYFNDAFNLMCLTNGGFEDTKHFFCFAYHLILNDKAFSLEFRNYYDPLLKSIVSRESVLLHLLLYGGKHFPGVGKDNTVWW